MYVHVSVKLSHKFSAPCNTTVYTTDFMNVTWNTYLWFYQLWWLSPVVQKINSIKHTWFKMLREDTYIKFRSFRLEFLTEHIDHLWTYPSAFSMCRKGEVVWFHVTETCKLYACIKSFCGSHTNNIILIHTILNVVSCFTVNFLIKPRPSLSALFPWLNQW